MKKPPSSSSAVFMLGDHRNYIIASDFHTWFQAQVDAENVADMIIDRFKW
ncbi:hypothetical protein [Paenibacillus gallinarum]|nr:hypothetical protein [Paenibacillus gallinarum]